jgi:hypothetical protein
MHRNRQNEPNRQTYKDVGIVVEQRPCFHVVIETRFGLHIESIVEILFYGMELNGPQCNYAWGQL